MIINIQDNRELQAARRVILCSHVFLVLLLLSTTYTFAWLQKSHAGDVASAFKNLHQTWIGFYLCMWFSVFVCQIFGYYKLAKVGRNLLIFRCIAFPYIADAILSLGLFLILPNASVTTLFNSKIITFFLYTYYSCKLFYELSRVTQEHFFRQGILLLSLSLSLLLFTVVLSQRALLAFLFLIGILVGWGMIFIGFYRLKYISTH
ncbi:phosphatidylglycerophosphate synthase [Helicobacter suis]|uniref:phosphatidylglycerophosphate synthase n=1 Tax=Helicobacter suis TaxID=104628 RepID=UPI0024924DEC|nr:phosphatidylglycerophosphate synthase [Helicobacter suis]